MLGSAKTKVPSLLWPAEWKEPAPLREKWELLIWKSDGTDGGDAETFWESKQFSVFFSAFLQKANTLTFISSSWSLLNW